MLKNKTKEIEHLNGTTWGDVSLSSASGIVMKLIFFKKIVRELFYQKENMGKLIPKAYLDILEIFEESL